MAIALQPRLVDQTLDDLAEDFSTAWVPDVGGNFDASLFAAGGYPGTGPLVQPLAVPKADGTTMHVQVLHPGWHVRLHGAVAGIRASVGEALAPGVFGYRRGAAAQCRYADEWRRFSDFSRDASAQSRYVVFSDIRRFFAHLPWDSVIDGVAETCGAVPPELTTLAADWESAGLTTPPAGYADARLLAHCVLHGVDRQLPMRFARWVDDYRLFVDQDMHPEQAVQVLRVALETAGLELNMSKTRVVPATEAATETANSLASAYHPDRDPPDRVRANLRAILSEAVESPVRHRRALRFVLARLAREHDDVALTFAVEAITKYPWEAPRLVSYLACFADHPVVVGAVNSTLAAAAEERDAWLLCRLGALACRTGVSVPTAALLADVLPDIADGPGWGMGLRVLAVHGHSKAVHRLLRCGIGEPRAALIALSDLGDPSPVALRRAEPVTAAAVESGPAALPPVESLL